MSDKKFYCVNLVNVVPSYERRFCFFFIEIKRDEYYSYKISDYYPTNVKKKISIRLIQSLPFYEWFQRPHSVSHDLIFSKSCSYFMVRRLGTTYTIQECHL